MPTKNEFIIEVWERTGKETAGAAELDLIQAAVAERFGHGAPMSPASIARVLADHGVRLTHPEVLQADARWRERNELFDPENLDPDTIEAVTELIETLELTSREFQDDPVMFERLRQSVRQMQAELNLIASSEKTRQKRRELARETAQWLTVWLQNPQIFPEWLALRRATSEFRELFGTFPPP
jgi:hypothetical protein